MINFKDTLPFQRLKLLHESILDAIKREPETGDPAIMLKAARKALLRKQRVPGWGYPPDDNEITWQKWGIEQLQTPEVIAFIEEQDLTAWLHWRSRGQDLWLCWGQHRIGRVGRSDNQTGFCAEIPELGLISGPWKTRKAAAKDLMQQIRKHSIKLFDRDKVDIPEPYFGKR